MLRCRNSLRRVAPKGARAAASWHELGNFASKDSDQASFRDARNRAATVEGVVANAKSGKDLKINWAEWESSIKHKEIVSCLKDFHAKQMELLKSVSGEDHKKAVESQSSGWDLYEKSVVSCENSVQASKTLVQNGATALWISFHNPPISHASQNEWLDTDQYWQAFVEKHHYYHNHINSATEDPESLEWDAKIEADNLFMWNRFDGRGVSRFNNKLMSSKPTYEYYDCFRGKLVEHMIYYLAKTGGDARFFPELMSFEQFNELYAKRNQVYNVLQRRRRIEQEAAVAQETALTGLPADVEHDGEGFALKTIAKENVTFEFMTARLMGNYMFLCEPYIPVQTRLGMYKALASDGGKGKFYSFGDDVNALFYKTTDTALPSPVESLNSYLNHVNMSGKRTPVLRNVMDEVFVELVESRKEVTGGSWFNAPDESFADAFMRRVSKFDPSREVHHKVKSFFQNVFRG